MRWARVTESVCRLPISNAQHRVLICLMTYADHETGYCYPSVGTIARELSRTRSTVRHHLNGLVESGVITRDPMPRKDGSRGANRYCVARLRYIEPAPAHQPAAAQFRPLEKDDDRKDDRIIQPALLLPINGGTRHRKDDVRRIEGRRIRPQRQHRAGLSLNVQTALAEMEEWGR
jgi:hypothetical protein